MKMLNEFNNLIKNTRASNMVGSDGRKTIERFEVFFKYINNGNTVFHAQEVRNDLGLDKKSLDYVIYKFKREGILINHKETFIHDGVIVHSLYIIASEDEFFQEEINKKYGSHEKRRESLSAYRDCIYSEVDKEKDVDGNHLEKLFSFKLTPLEYNYYRKLHKSGMGRTAIAEMFGITRQQLVAGADNGNQRKFKEMQCAN